MSTQGTPIAQPFMEYRKGNAEAASKLVPFIDAELRRLLPECLPQETAAHELRAASLITDAYVALLPAQDVDHSGRLLFASLATPCLRRLLLDYAVRANSPGPSVSNPGFERYLLFDLKPYQFIALDEGCSTRVVTLPKRRPATSASAASAGSASHCHHITSQRAVALQPLRDEVADPAVGQRVVPAVDPRDGLPREGPARPGGVAEAHDEDRILSAAAVGQLADRVDAVGQAVLQVARRTRARACRGRCRGGARARPAAGARARGRAPPRRTAARGSARHPRSRPSSSRARRRPAPKRAASRAPRARPRQRQRGRARARPEAWRARGAAPTPEAERREARRARRGRGRGASRQYEHSRPRAVKPTDPRGVNPAAS